jgi:asparagine synthase (glutamine-hydrolysing)
VSGIAGLIRLDDEPIRSRDVAALAAAIAHRGPDATQEWRNPRAALVCSELRTVPTPIAGRPPLVQDGVVLVADARLDNRDELLRQLDLKTTWSTEIDDAVLLRHAFGRWGRSCSTHLEGDFALVVYHERTREIFCTRDRFGVRPLVYCHFPGRLFAFASEVRALLMLPEVHQTLDELRIANFLVMCFDDRERTFYQAIKRLPGGTSLTLRDGAAVAIPAPYWSLRDVTQLNLADSREYEERFRWHFIKAVKDRSRVSDPEHLACMLSGGLDSTSIACVVRDQRREAGEPALNVLSWVFSGVKEADEREYQEIAANTGGLVRHVLDTATSRYCPWTDLELLQVNGPLYAPNFYMNYGAGQKARSLGARVLLDGLGGDSTVSSGTARFSELLRRGHWPTLLREVTKFAQHDPANRSWARLLFSYALVPQMPAVFSTIVRTAHTDASAAHESLLRPRFVTLLEERQANLRRPRTCFEAHRAALESPMAAEGLELFDRVLAMTQVEGRYPFFDRALVELCLSLPAEQRLAHGYSRSILRRALEGVLPAAIQWRSDKGKPGLHVIPALRASRELLDDLLVRDAGGLAAYLCMDELHRRYRDFMDGRATPFATVVQLWSAAALSSWLRKEHPSAASCASTHSTAPAPVLP